MAGIASTLLDEQLHLARKLASMASGDDPDVRRLAEVCLRFDRHMRRGGALPTPWIFIQRTPGDDRSS